MTNEGATEAKRRPQTHEGPQRSVCTAKTRGSAPRGHEEPAAGALGASSDDRRERGACTWSGLAI
ncbi:Hypothetical protein GSB_153675 [Giardia duodenalis]|uniref:Uncharacterized protein n=1 Tax=Giardia intestinalis TaxID=5741 RepID=V6TQ07_GIAIN|nr:Hypothetical protein GSB_153675 [Giardia intestinalis]